MIGDEVVEVMKRLKAEPGRSFRPEPFSLSAFCLSAPSSLRITTHLSSCHLRSAMPSPIRVTVWGENVHEQKHQVVRDIYPDGMHRCIADGLAESDDFRCGARRFRNPTTA